MRKKGKMLIRQNACHRFLELPPFHLVKIRENQGLCCESQGDETFEKSVNSKFAYGKFASSKNLFYYTFFVIQVAAKLLEFKVGGLKEMLTCRLHVNLVDNKGSKRVRFFRPPTTWTFIFAQDDLNQLKIISTMYLSSNN